MKKRDFVSLIKALIFISIIFISLTIISCVTQQKKPPTPISEIKSTSEGKIYYTSSNPFEHINILDDSLNDTSTIVFGELKIPNIATGKVPAIIYMHGAGGWSEKNEPWLRQLNKMGIATFRIDSLTPRNRASTVGNQTRVTSAMMVADAYNALKFLSEHSRSDKKKIVIMENSNRAGVSLYPEAQHSSIPASKPRDNC